MATTGWATLSATVICGRTKEIYISGGENVYPGEIEAVIGAHPAVADAAVVGVPDQRSGESSLAVVQCVSDPAAPAEDIVFCRQRLAGFQIPCWVVFLDQLPHLATGMIDKRWLAQMALRQDEAVP
jgi:fatty-acyl-CoA synthase